MKFQMAPASTQGQTPRRRCSHPEPESSERTERPLKTWHVFLENVSRFFENESACAKKRFWPDQRPGALCLAVEGPARLKTPHGRRRGKHPVLAQAPRCRWRPRPGCHRPQRPPQPPQTRKSPQERRGRPPAPWALVVLTRALLHPRNRVLARLRGCLQAPAQPP